MNFILMRLYEIATVVLPALIVHAALNRRAIGRAPGTKGHLPLVVVFAVYIAATLYFTGAGTLWHIRMYGIDLRPEQINLVPFSQSIDRVAYFQNILLLAPLGFLLPCIWPRGRNLPAAILSGLGYSLLIELSQLLNYRATDVDDLIMNTAGAVAGYILFRLFALLTRYRSARTQYSAAEPAIYIAAMFTGHFLLYNEMWLAGILYGF